MSSEGALAPPRLPSECLAAAERDHDKPGVVAEREKYRALLQDATFTVLDNTRQHHEKLYRAGSGGSSPGGRGDAVRGLALMDGRDAIGGHATAYVCRHYACGAPVTDAAALAGQLAAP